MKYRIDKRLEKLRGDELFVKGESTVEVMTRTQYRASYADLPSASLLLRSLEHVQYCKADMLHGCAVGTFLLPKRRATEAKEISFGYYMDDSRLIFVDDSGTVEKMLEEFEEQQVLQKTVVAHFFFEFLEYLIHQDVMFLQEYENRLNDLEELLLVSDVKNFENKLYLERKGLLRLTFYYSQLSDLADSLADNPNGILNNEDCRIFRLFSDRVSRLGEHTRALREYSLQLHEIYQSKIDVHQNKIMQFLTVITTVFLPLTLIVGWYGMNFSGMKELQYPYSYPIVIAVSVLITVIEILYFKKKNWFK